MILIRYSNGLVLQGIVLSFGERVVRVAIKDADDAAEFHMMNGVWVSEDCEIVCFEFVAQGSSVQVHGDDFLEAMLTAGTAPAPLQRVM